MQTTTGTRPAAEILAEVARLLDLADPDPSPLSDAERLAAVSAARRASGRLQALAAALASEAADVGAADRRVGVPLASWLAATERLTRREAHRLIGQGDDLRRFPGVLAAALGGSIGFEQGCAVGGVLRQLPSDFSAEQVARAESTMLGYAREFDSAGLARLSRRLVEVIDPVGAEEREFRRLERELKVARAERFLSFLPNGHGSVLIRGSLPTVEAEPLAKLVDAYAQAERRRAAIEADRRDPLAESVTPAMRRADALCALVVAHQLDALAPSCGGDRPRVVVTLSYDALLRDCISAAILESGEPMSAGELRRLACDADLVPAVLGAASEVLDVGRAQRLVTPAIRLAVTVRDGGCVFPGCDAPPAVCHAHHLTPWWAGGHTTPDNLALVCPHHHNLVEPGRDAPSDERRWHLRMADDEVPEVVPPAHVDRARVPLRHQRFRLPPAG